MNVYSADNCWMRKHHFAKPAFAQAGAFPKAIKNEAPIRVMEPELIPADNDVPDDHAGEFLRREFTRGRYEIWLAGRWQWVTIIKSGERFLTVRTERGGQMTLHNESFFVNYGSEPAKVQSEFRAVSPDLMESLRKEYEDSLYKKEYQRLIDFGYSIADAMSKARTYAEQKANENHKRVMRGAA